MKIWHIDSSARVSGSHSRRFTGELANGLRDKLGADIIYRDVSTDIELLNNTIVSGLFLPDENRTTEQKKSLKLSDKIIEEALATDIWVIGIPIYNFSMPASLKAWADLLARIRVTFKYSDNGPVGLLEKKKAYVIIVSGGTDISSEIDFLTPWLIHYLKFIGVVNVTIVKADKYSDEKEEIVSNDLKQILSKYKTLEISDFPSNYGDNLPKIPA